MVIEEAIRNLYAPGGEWKRSLSRRNRGEEARRLRWLHSEEARWQEGHRLARVAAGLSPNNSAGVEWEYDGSQYCPVEVRITRQTTIQSRLEVYAAMQTKRLKWVPVIHDEIEEIMHDRTMAYPSLPAKIEGLWTLRANLDEADWLLEDRVNKAIENASYWMDKAEEKIIRDTMTLVRREGVPSDDE